jgi:methyltransferase (TIGR00027 family)
MEVLLLETPAVRAPMSQVLTHIVCRGRMHDIGVIAASVCLERGQPSRMVRPLAAISLHCDTKEANKYDCFVPPDPAREATRCSTHFRTRCVLITSTSKAAMSEQGVVPVVRDSSDSGTRLCALMVLTLAVVAAVLRLTPPPTAHAQSKLAADKPQEEMERMLSPEAQISATTAFIVASMRASESQRPDAIINDPFAQHLAGDIASQMQLLAGVKWSPPGIQLAQSQELLALRTRCLDEALSHRSASFPQVVILGSGLDTRAYRLEALRGRLVVEIDATKDLLDHKRRVLEQANAHLMAKHYHTIVADLAEDSWEQKLLDGAGFDPTERTYWCMEGLLSYLNRDGIVKLLKTIDALSPPGSMFWADMAGDAIVKEGLVGSQTLKYGEDDPLNGVLGITKWKLRVQVDLGQPGEHFGRKWTPVTLGKEKPQPLPMSFITGTKPSSDKKRAPFQ